MQGIIPNLKLIWKFYDLRMKYILLCILFLIFINASLEFFAVITIKPIISQIINNSSFSESLNLIFFKIDTQNNYLIYLILITSISLAILLRVINFWIISRFSGKTGSLIAIKIFSSNLLTKYYKFKSKKAGSIISALTNQMDSFVTGLMYLFKLISSLIICIFIFSGLLINNFAVNLLISILFISVYIFSYFFIKGRLEKNSSTIKNKSETRIDIIKDSIGANKEIIANNLQSYFEKSYSNSEIKMRYARANNYTLKILPRSIIEFLVFAVIILISIVSTIYKQNSGVLIAYLGSLAFSVQRLMPQMQTIFLSYSFLSSAKASIKNILKLMTEFNNYEKIYNHSKKIKFKQICLENIYFNYEDKSKHIFKNFNLSVNKGDRIGIIGKSGSGKSTLIDLIIGIIKPDKGKIKINNIDIHLNKNEDFLYKWRNSFGLINQNPYILNNSIEANIIFGNEKEKINMKYLVESAKKAQIFNFIDSLPKKFSTKTGEMGSNFSGGQTQRICLARTFYSNKKILIMDEATSSLDEETESRIINSLKALDKDITLIIITHRKALLEICNKVVNIDNENDN